MLGDGPGQAEAVEGGGAAPDLVQQHQALGRGRVEDARRLLHLQHERGLAAGDVVGGAHAGEQAVRQRHLRLGRGHERSGVRQQDDEGRLPQERRLPAHVGPGDDDELLRRVVEQQVVGDERRGRSALDDRMPALADAQLRAVVHPRLRVVECVRRLRQRRQHVDRGNRPRRLQDAGRFGRDLQPQRLEQRLLHVEQALVRAQRLVLVLLERRRDVALARGHGLPALVVLGHGMQVRLRHLDVVAEHPVEADLEVADAGPLALRPLHGRYLLLRVAADRAQLVERGVHAVANAAAVARQRRRLVDQGRPDGLAHVGDVVELRREAAHERRSALGKVVAHLRDQRHRLPQRDHVARPGRAQGDARHEALQVVHRLERPAQPGAVPAARHQLLDRVEPVVDRLDRARRTLQPGAQQASPHRGRRAVDLAQQRPVAAAVRGGNDLQVPQRGGVDQHVVGPRAEVDAPHVRQVHLLGVPQVLDQRAGRGGGRRVAGELGTIERGGAKLVAQRLARMLHAEHPGVERRDRQVERRKLREYVEQRQITGDDHLARPQHRHFVHDGLPSAAAGVLRRAELAGRQVDQRRAPYGVFGLLPPAAAGRERQQERGLPGVEVAGVGKRTGRDHAHDLAPQRRLRLARGGGILDLLADGHAEAALDQPRHVGVGGVVGYAAHRDGAAAGVLRPRSQRQLQRLRRGQGVLVEELVEVAHAEEDQGVAMLALGLQVLSHRRRGPGSPARLGRGGHGGYGRGV